MISTLDIKEIEQLIPQRYPFLMLDRVLNIVEGKSLRALKNISIDEECFKGHFSHAPIFPGALTIEALAQAACVLVKKSIPDLNALIFYVTNVKVRFFRPVVPGDQLHINVKTVKLVRVGGIFEVEAVVDDNIVAKGEMAFACK